MPPGSPPPSTEKTSPTTSAVKANWEEQLRDFLLDKQKSSGIIYCLSRKNVEDTAELVRSWGFQALPYHAGLPKEQREQHQQAFIKDEVPIIVATVAFGMGIDKPNVRYVVHVSMPQNIEGYYQETGRAGRDGLPSEALLFYGVSDVIILEKILNNGENAAFNATMQQKLQKMKGFCLANTCRRRYLLGYFGEQLTEDCGNCDRCFAKSRLEDVTVPAQMLLSAIVRTGQQYGLQHPILVLRGSKSAKISEEQRALSLYGIGKDRPEQFWRSLGERLQVEATSPKQERPCPY
ncbi:RecQ family ATP-dependent DNA helicase [Nitritalea halalkaliphila]|uniref:RecQ family ATP-dependent DNA helicase n=1 Tax=Nitritalea halalkaliphila TaxID=590849 RepID=UPI001EE65A02|nr:RecQ family ATP-dependent DNA helicase [Nitritalea halalkaliphila]